MHIKCIECDADAVLLKLGFGSLCQFHAEKLAANSECGQVVNDDLPYFVTDDG